MKAAATMKKFGLTPKKQDKKFPTETMYAVVFFAKVVGPGTRIYPHGMIETCAHTASKAKHLFLGRTSDNWRRLKGSGWQVRKIRITDLGPAE